MAEVNGSPGSHDYAVYYSAALRFLEKDPFREIAFALITTTQTQPLLNIHMWNETLAGNLQFITISAYSSVAITDLSK